MVCVFVPFEGIDVGMFIWPVYPICPTCPVYLIKASLVNLYSLYMSIQSIYLSFLALSYCILPNIILGWLVGWTTHSSSRGPQAQPPPADLRVSSGNVIAALPASFWWPSRAETGTREEGLKTANRDWAPTFSQAQAKQGHTQDTNRLQPARYNI